MWAAVLLLLESREIINGLNVILNGFKTGVPGENHQHAVNH
jgi:hypothetical protein